MKKKTGGSKVYKLNGDIDPIDETFNGKPFFRKITNINYFNICNVLIILFKEPL